MRCNNEWKIERYCVTRWWYAYGNKNSRLWPYNGCDRGVNDRRLERRDAADVASVCFLPSLPPSHNLPQTLTLHYHDFSIFVVYFSSQRRIPKEFLNYDDRSSSSINKTKTFTKFLIESIDRVVFSFPFFFFLFFLLSIERDSF